MTLKATLIVNAIKGADMVIWFAKDHNYNLAVDEEVVWHIVSQRQPGCPMEGNFNIPKMLIVQEIAYEKSNQPAGKKGFDLAKMFGSNESKKTVVQ